MAVAWRQYLQQELYHFRVDESVHRLSIDVRDQVPGLQARLAGWASFFHILKSRRRGYISKQTNDNPKPTASSAGLFWVKYQRILSSWEEIKKARLLLPLSSF